MKTQNIAIRSVFAVSLAAAAIGAQAQVVAFSSYGAGMTWSDSGWSITGPASTIGWYVDGSQFVAQASGALHSIDIPLAHYQGTGNAMIARLYESDSAGEIGTLIESWTFVNVAPFSSQGASYHRASLTGAPISAGTAYWMTVWPDAPDVEGVWMFNPVGMTLPFASSQNGGVSWQYTSVNGVGAFQINVVPEPASLTVIATAIGAMALRRRKRA